MTAHPPYHEARPVVQPSYHSRYILLPELAIQAVLQDDAIVKNTLSILWLLLALCLWSPPAAQAAGPWKSEDTCRFGMPLIGHAVKQGGTGLITDILKAVYQPEHITLTHLPLPYSRAVAAVQAGEIHCTLDIKDNHKGVLQGRATMAFYDLSAAYLRTTEFSGMDDLADKKVAYLHGFDMEPLLSVKIRPQVVYDLSSAFHMLDRDFVAYVLDDSLLLKDAMYESRLPASDFQITPIKSFEVRPIFAPTDQGRRLRDIYDRRIKEMIASGELQDILRINGIGEPTIEKIIKAN